MVYNKKNFHIKPTDIVDYKDIDLLRKFITDQGKILPRRSTGLTAKQQKIITRSIKRARTLALLPFLNKD
ncbi:MAG: 30S ribosomal protein S18 [Moorea sp. SIO3G5]|nr:30S ribosomal protein S18 [Moorena sp. SIO3G5]